MPRQRYQVVGYIYLPRSRSFAGQPQESRRAAGALGEIQQDQQVVRPGGGTLQRLQPGVLETLPPRRRQRPEEIVVIVEIVAYIER